MVLTPEAATAILDQGTIRRRSDCIIWKGAYLKRTFDRATVCR